MSRSDSPLKGVTFAISLALAQCWVSLVQANESADYVFANGKVYTVNDEQPWAEAVAEMDAQIRILGPSPLRATAPHGLDSLIDEADTTTNESADGCVGTCSVRDPSPASPGRPET